MESLILLALAPIFYGCMLWEALYWRRRGVAQYTWRDTLSNMTLAGMHQVETAICQNDALTTVAADCQHFDEFPAIPELLQRRPRSA